MTSISARKKTVRSICLKWNQTFAEKGQISDKVTYVEEDAVIDLEGVIYDTEEGLLL